jgi:hypothetical protein
MPIANVHVHVPQDLTKLSIKIVFLLLYLCGSAVSRNGFNEHAQRWTHGRNSLKAIWPESTPCQSLSTSCEPGHFEYFGSKRPLQTALYLRGGSADNQDDPDLPDSLIIGPVTNFSWLENFYSTGPTNKIFLTKIEELKKKYGGIRTVKGDGNCFIRGYIFQVMESCIANRTEAGGLQGLLTGYYFSITDQSTGLGYSPIAIDDFYQDVQNQVQAHCQHRSGAPNILPIPPPPPH